MFSLEIVTLARLLVDEARERSLRIVTAESCTGGLVAFALTSVPGSSQVFDRGFVDFAGSRRPNPGRRSSLPSLLPSSKLGWGWDGSLAVASLYFDESMN